MDELIRRFLDKTDEWKDKPAQITPLDGGITNQNFRVDIGVEAFVIRICSKNSNYLGIYRDHEYACSKIAAELGIGADVIHYVSDDGILMSRFIEGTPVSAEEAGRPDSLARILESIKCIHNGPEFPGRFSAFETVRSYYRFAKEAEVSFPDTLPAVLELMHQIESAVTGLCEDVSCHNDLLAANFLDDGKTMRIIDWEYGGMGDPFFDLGNFSVNQDLNDDQIDQLLACYLTESRDVDVAHLKLMMLASDLRESFWGFLQSGISSLEFDYSAYASKHFDRFYARASTPECRAWIDTVSV
jgi:thiamine kinase-like enzyme